MYAQNADKRWAIGLHTNVTNYTGDLGNEFGDFSNIDLGIGASLGYYLTPTFDIVGKFDYAQVGYADEDGTYAQGARGYADFIGSQLGDWRFSGDMFTANANLVFKFNNGWLFKEDTWFRPFLTGGIGNSVIDAKIYRNTRSDKKYNHFELYYGGGIKFALSDVVNLVFEAGIHDPMTDVYDGIDKGTAPGWPGSDDSNDQFLQYSMGLTFNLGKKRDSDNDGVRDKDDLCPNTFEGLAVDESGCPIDTDKDGFPDYKDDCPNLFGAKDGCPDTDGDGIADPVDVCPDEAGLPSLLGCPDADGDGVIDSKDDCPNTPKNAKVSPNGCPVDIDGDGVLNEDDMCKDVPGPKSNKGCPIPKPTEAIFTVYFDTNEASLSKDAKVILDKVVQTYNDQGKGVGVGLVGHADIRGSDNYNLNLSKKRAKNVKKYLVKKGIDNLKILVTAEGEKIPISEDYAKNRRVDIVIELK